MNKNTKKIFIACPTLDDTEYPISIKNAFDSAKNPERVFFGTAYSTDFKNKKKFKDLKNSINEYKSNIKLEIINFSIDIGVGHGRLASMNFYDNEDYVLQVDAHCLWQKNWDENLINLYEEAQEKIKYQKILLTGYMPYFKYYGPQNRNVVNGWHLRYPFLLGSTFKQWGHPWDRLCSWTDIEIYHKFPDIKDKFVPSVKASAGFIFGGPEFAKEYKKIVPFPFFFFEEELVMTIELLDSEFCLVHVNGDIPIAHLYMSDVNEFGGKRASGKAASEKESNYVCERYLNYLNDNREKVKKFEEYSMCKNILNPDPSCAFKIPENFYRGKNE
jgi:hypothetical protein